ncbi:MAG: hypothetical protein WKF58_06645 [Ilumatobacteraceae bacterium]
MATLAPVDGEPDRLMEADGRGVLLGRDAANGADAKRGDLLREALVQPAAHAVATMLGGDADEVHVRLVGSISRDEPDEESGELAVLLGDEGCRGEVLEEQRLQQLDDGSAVPPLREDGGDRRVVVASALAELHGHGCTVSPLDSAIGMVSAPSAQ